MTGNEHLAAAERADDKAQVAVAQYDSEATAIRPAVKGPVDAQIYEERLYNPTREHLVEADRQYKLSVAHMKEAQALDAFEDAACVGMTKAERLSCPVLAPHLASVAEVPGGVALRLKPSAPIAQMARQLRCHLAFAESTDFVSVPCPLFVKGVRITMHEGSSIDVLSTDAKVARQVQIQAHRMFGFQPVSAIPAG